ncbi:ABC transporter permease subunit [Fictibacillus iocasae]|uniref:ABC transporter permease subunit n=1 Tax=Fictibacillus iocasae TaxID=2715437 RepID=A0ABW2NS91_9BACL
MNILKRELKSSVKSTLFWIAGIIALVAGGMSKYGSLAGSGQSMNDMMAAMPKSLQALFGVSSVDVSSAPGYYVVIFSYILLIAAIHAGLLGAGIVAKEERDKTAEFLFSKPVSRTEVLLAKLAASLVLIVIINSVMLLVSDVSLSYYGSGEDAGNQIAFLYMLLYGFQLLFLSIGAMIASVLKKPKQAVGITASIILASYLLSIVIALNENLAFLKFVTPFRYIDANEVLFGSGGTMLPFMALSIVLSFVLLCYAISSYRKRDLTV